ncbi:MAG: hypothetical protein ACI36W_04935 [Coriobacteriales bacterium]
MAKKREATAKNLQELSRQELNERFGVTEELLGKLEEEFGKGNWELVENLGPGIASIRIGRPPLCDEALKTLSFKEPESKVIQIEQRCKSLGVSRSTYLRGLVDEDLARAAQAQAL